MRLSINENEEIFLDGNPLRYVTGYRLKHDAGEDAELQVTLAVKVDRVFQKNKKGCDVDT